MFRYVRAFNHGARHDDRHAGVRARHALHVAIDDLYGFQHAGFALSGLAVLRVIYHGKGWTYHAPVNRRVIQAAWIAVDSGRPDGTETMRQDNDALSDSEPRPC